MESDESTIAGRYRLVEFIGNGSMGTVWRGVDERLGRSVAVKQLSAHSPLRGETAEQALVRGRREARNAACLEHPGAIAVHDVVIESDQLWIVMEYFRGRSLEDLVRDVGPLPPRDVAAIGEQIASALAAAHEVGVVHRDVKPQNILIDTDRRAKLTDFGVSRSVGDGAATADSMVVGTPMYFAPEVARGHPGSSAADVFSLGSSLYFAVEGSPPFGVFGNTIAALHAAATGVPRPPVRSGALAPLLRRLLSADAATRPTMAQTRAELADIAADLSQIRATDVSAWSQPVHVDHRPLDAARTRTLGVRRSARARRALVALVALIAIVGVAALVVRQNISGRSGKGINNAGVVDQPTTSVAQRPEGFAFDVPAQGADVAGEFRVAGQVIGLGADKLWLFVYAQNGVDFVYYKTTDDALAVKDNAWATTHATLGDDADVGLWFKIVAVRANPSCHYTILHVGPDARGNLVVGRVLPAGCMELGQLVVRKTG